MKNIHLIPTTPNDETAKGIWIKETRDWCNLYITSNEEIKEGSLYLNNKVIFKADDIFNEGNNPNNSNPRVTDFNKKIILTTDVYLIKYGVQAIDDEFLEWFVKNPSCEKVDIEEEDYSQKCRECGETVKRGYSCRKGCFMKSGNFICTDKYIRYKIITPKEEQKQHLIDMMRGDEELGLYDEPKRETTLEEAIKREYERRKFNSDFPFDPQSFKLGAKWEAKRRYSEEEVLVILYEQLESLEYYGEHFSFSLFWEQFKKK